MSQRHTTHFDEIKKLCALKIKNAKPDDAGVYTLVIENPYGSDQSSGQVSIMRPVEERPRHSSSLPSPSPIVRSAPSSADEPMGPPRILKHLQPETTVNEGQPITLTCMIDSPNIPNVIFKNKYFKTNNVLRFHFLFN
jgi:hypothetical protein